MLNCRSQWIARHIFKHCIARFRSVGERQFYKDSLTCNLFQGRNEALFIYQEVLFAAFAVYNCGNLAALAIAFRRVAAYLSPDGRV